MFCESRAATAFAFATFRVSLGYPRKRSPWRSADWKNAVSQTVSPESPGSRMKILALTAEGMDAQKTYGALVWSIEKRWESRFGKSAVAMLRDLLERLVCGEGDAKSSLLFLGLEAYPSGWRASLPKPEVLPHYPMVLHRGGYPDGS